jgi:predicted alpha/beta-fold hydrolase
VLLLHGLEGGFESGYVAAVARGVQRRRWQLALLEFRSCGEMNRLQRTYHSGETADLDFVVGELRRRRPGRSLYLLGFSLGGNVLLKWLGERGDAVPPEVIAAAAVSPPFDLSASARVADRRFGGLMSRWFLRSLVPKALAKAAQFPGLLDVAAVRRCRSFAEFDDAVTAPLHGFRDAAHYWSDSSCTRYLGGIRRPTLVLASADDPLSPASVIPRPAIAASPYLVPQLTERGGHVGFREGATPWRSRRWAEEQALRFFGLHERWRSGPR